MEIKRIGSQPSAKGPADWFTGTVRIDPLFDRTDPARVGGASVTFEPGARTAWHTHPLGQTLIVTGGCGWAQREGGPVEEIRPGDVVWFPPGEKHWHGATATTAMTHIAIQEKLDGKAVDWMEKVSDEQYRNDGRTPKGTSRADVMTQPVEALQVARLYRMNEGHNEQCHCRHRCRIDRPGDRAAGQRGQTCPVADLRRRTPTRPRKS